MIGNNNNIDMFYPDLGPSTFSRVKYEYEYIGDG